MALSLRSMFGTGVARGKSANDAELEMPTTTQVKMNPPAQGYDPLGAASIMEQLRTAAAETRQTGRLWSIGHLPAAKQEQSLGALTAGCVVPALVMLLFSITLDTQPAAS